MGLRRVPALILRQASSTGHTQTPDPNLNTQLQENLENMTGRSRPEISWCGKLRVQLNMTALT